MVKELQALDRGSCGAIRVYDGAGGLFMTQGIFVP